MATFSTCIRNQSPDGYYNVYIMVVHKGSPQYIKTTFRVKQKGVRKVYNEKGKEKLEVSDPFVLKECLIIIDGYFTRKDFSSVDKLKDRVIKYVFVNRVVKKRKLQKIKRGK